MALSTTTNKVIHTGNGATTVWPFTFPILDATHLSVVYTDASGVEATVPASQYSVTGIGSAAGGSVTYRLSTGSPIAAGTKLTLLRTVPETQNTVLSNQGAYFPEVVEGRFDLTTMMIQQLDERLQRANLSPLSGALPFPTVGGDLTVLGKLSVIPPSTSGASGGTTIAATSVLTGTGPGGGINVNLFNVSSDNTDQGEGFVQGLTSQLYFGGSTVKGGRIALYGLTTQTATTSSANGQRNYVGVQGDAVANATDGGVGQSSVLVGGTTTVGSPVVTGVANTSTIIVGSDVGSVAFPAGTTVLSIVLNTSVTVSQNATVAQTAVIAYRSAKGGYFGLAGVVRAGAAAVNLLNITGAEFDVFTTTGASVHYRSGIQITAGGDLVQGAVYDCMIGLSNQSVAFWKDGILFGPMNGAFPLAATATILRTIGGTITNGIDLAGSTFTGYPYRSNNFTVDFNGDVAGRNLLTSGNVEVAAGSKFFSTGRAQLSSQADGRWRMTDTTQLTFTALTLGLETNLFPALMQDGPGLKVMAGDLTTGAFIAGVEQTAPSAPAANGYRIFAQDNGAGKTQLMVAFATGGALQLAIQP